MRMTREQARLWIVEAAIAVVGAGSLIYALLDQARMLVW